MKMKDLAYALIAGILLMFLTIHLSAWSYIFLSQAIPRVLLQNVTAHLSFLILTVVPGTLLVLFPFGWLVWNKNPFLQGLVVGVFCVLSFGVFRIYLEMPLLTDYLKFQVIENGLQIFAAAMFSKAGALARNFWMRSRAQSHPW